MGHFHLVVTDAGIGYFRTETLFRVMFRMGRTKNTNNFRVFVALTPGFGKICEQEVNVSHVQIFILRIWKVERL